MTTGRPMKTNGKSGESAADEGRAYDVLAMLMRLHGVQLTLDVLRYWYIVSSLNGTRRAGHSAAGRKRQSV